MILTTSKVLSVDRCEPWTDEKTIEFMNTEPFQTVGNKTLQNFLDSKETTDIQFDEIFWVILNCIGKINSLDFGIKVLELYSEETSSSVGDLFTELYFILDNINNITGDIDDLLLRLDENKKNDRIAHKDITDTYRIYNFASMLINDIKYNLNINKTVKNICYTLINNFPNTYRYEIFINDIISYYE